ncbi:MAG: nickel pincer cofactor biosynthesis protein LarC [Chloroflexi bacterium]|nr:nickel pincer cofactor biosynthesis protein LarC [Chloroflexota bacterium]
MKAAYLHLIGGVSGDMLLAALLDSGLSLSQLKQELSKLPVSGYSLEAAAAIRGGIAGTHLTITLSPWAEAPRQPAEMVRILESSSLPAQVKEQAKEVLGRLAAAEARVHRQEGAEVRLHELGSLDTLLDVTGVVLGLHLLGVQRVFASPLPLGSGWVQTQHGLLPAAAPATVELIAMAKAPVLAPPHQPLGEQVTPTGAALVTTLAKFSRPVLHLEKVGYGLGTREVPGLPNLLAVWLGEVEEGGGSGGLVLLETNIDDQSPQVLGYIQERLLALGAVDVWLQPIQMKKGRPGLVVNVLLPSSLEAMAVGFLFQETTTLGVRSRPIQRHEAQRQAVVVPTSLGPVPVKVKRWGEQMVGVGPEYEVCRTIALAQRLPLQEVLRRVAAEAWAFLMPEQGKS